MAAEAADALYPATPDLDAKSLGSSSNIFCSEGPRMHVTFFEASGGSAFAFAQTAQVACNPGTRAALQRRKQGKEITFSADRLDPGGPRAAGEELASVLLCVPAASLNDPRFGKPFRAPLV